MFVNLQKLLCSICIKGKATLNKNQTLKTFFKYTGFNRTRTEITQFTRIICIFFIHAILVMSARTNLTG